MSAAGWIITALWLAAALAVALRRGLVAHRKARTGAALQRLKSPMIYLFAAYLLVAAFVTPLSASESTSPLLWLAAALPVAYAAGTFAAAAEERPHPLVRLGLAALFGGAVIAASAIILALSSPAFVPRWLR
jgi:hypothetical protein